MPQNKRRNPEPSSPHAELLSQVRKMTSQLSALEKSWTERLQNVESELTSLEKTSTGSLQEQKVAIADLLKRLSEVRSQLTTLQTSTVGTVEYQRAIDDAVAAMESTASIATQLPGAIQTQSAQLTGVMQNLQQTTSEITSHLKNLAAILSTVLELVQGPLRLSDESVKQLSENIQTSLRPIILKDVRETLSRTFSDYEQEFRAISDTAVRDMERLLEAQRAESARMDAVDRRITRGLQIVASFVLLAVVIGAGSVIVLGGAQGLSAVSGLPTLMPHLWAHVIGADSWYATLGWSVLAVGALAVIVGLILGVTYAVWRRIDPWMGEMVERVTNSSS